MPTEESPRRKMTRIVTIDDGEDYEDKAQYFEFESPEKPDGEGDLLNDYGDDNGRLKTENDLAGGLHE